MTTPTMEKIKVMLAFDEGKKIQWTTQGKTEWQGCYAPIWDWCRLNYRIAPQPPRKFTRYFIELFDGGLLGPYHSFSEAQARLHHSDAKVLTFEMMEILDNAER